MNYPRETDQYLTFAKNISVAAGDVLQQYRYSFKVEKVKDTLNLDIATSADYAAEKLITDAIRATYPTHGILAEESGVANSDAEYVWIIDPLDGTKEYTRNSPYYYTLLSLEHNGIPVCAVGYQPAIKRMFYGSVSSGAYVDTEKIHVSAETNFAKSFIQIIIPNGSAPKSASEIYLKAVQDLIYSTYRLRNTQWDVEALFNVSMGVAEGYIFPPSVPSYHGPKWWDISSGLQVVEMAGGKITDFYGNPMSSRDSSKGIIASNKLIHDSLLNLLKKYYPMT